MKYQEWLAKIPAEITDDPIWKTEVYRLGLFLGDLAWYDSVKLTLKPPTRSLSDQLYRAAGSVSANTCEGYSRASGKDQARFYEYALGSARETRDWYFKARHVLGPEITSHRLKLTAQVIRQLLRMIPKYRGESIREETAEYITTPLQELLENVPMPDYQFTHHAPLTRKKPMTNQTRTYDSLHMGRSSIDLYSNDVGAPFPEITSFAAYVGGSPTNISVGARRLGLKTALLTGLGVDPVGDFIQAFLDKEDVDTTYTVRKPGHRTSAVVLGIEPPDKFPLVYYRDNCADIELTIDDVLAAPIADAAVFQFAGTNLCKEPSRSATMHGAEIARRVGTDVVLDLDFRPTQWHDPRAFGVVVRSVLHSVDIVIGTDDEIKATVLRDTSQMHLTHSQISDTKVEGDALAAIRTLLSLGPKAVVQKVGALGARVHLQDGTVIEAPGFPVEIYNVLGAGDAFGAGFIYGYVHGWDWRKAARLGNACGAIVVTKHGCANFMPTYDEVMAFAEERGGL